MNARTAARSPARASNTAAPTSTHPTTYPGGSWCNAFKPWPGQASSPAGLCSSAVHTLPPIQTLTQPHPRPPSHNHVLTQNPARPKSYTLGPGENIADEWNAIHAADTPTTDALKKVPRRWRTIKAHGTAVGLPSDADMGNSEVRGGPVVYVFTTWQQGGAEVAGGGWQGSCAGLSLSVEVGGRRAWAIEMGWRASCEMEQRALSRYAFVFCTVCATERGQAAAQTRQGSMACSTARAAGLLRNARCAHSPCARVAPTRVLAVELGGVGRAWGPIFRPPPHISTPSILAPTYLFVHSLPAAEVSTNAAAGRCRSLPFAGGAQRAGRRAGD